MLPQIAGIVSAPPVARVLRRIFYEHLDRNQAKKDQLTSTFVKTASVMFERLAALHLFSGVRRPKNSAGSCLLHINRQQVLLVAACLPDRGGLENDLAGSSA